MNLRRASTQNWYKIENKANAPTRVDICDEIGFWGMTAQDFINDMRDLGDIDLHLNSPGGEVFDGIDIYNNLKQHSGIVAVYVDSLAASIASVIAMAASPGHLFIAKRGQMMIHDAFGMCMGNASDMRDLADLLDKQSDNVAGIYSDRTGTPAADWRKLMQDESWYDGQEAVDANLADSIIPETENKAPVDSVSSSAAGETNTAIDFDSVRAALKELQL
jgi:ATP-dependent protease ClpP protease subunit